MTAFYFSLTHGKVLNLKDLRRDANFWQKRESEIVRVFPCVGFTTFVVGFITTSARGGTLLPHRIHAVRFESTFPFSSNRTLPVTCLRRTDDEIRELKREAHDYQRSKRFQAKIKEAKGLSPLVATHVSIKDFLTDIIEPKWSVIELGCAAGVMLRVLKEIYADVGIQIGRTVGVELVPGWVQEARGLFPDTEFVEGDVTDFSLPSPQTFDFIMMNDVVEHIQKQRYPCLFSKLDELSHPGTLIYMHTPTPEAQQIDKNQYFDNVVPHHFLFEGMASVGFRVLKFEHDLDTVCKMREADLPRILSSARCLQNGWPKYYHVVFQKTDADVFSLS